VSAMCPYNEFYKDLLRKGGVDGFAQKLSSCAISRTGMSIIFLLAPLRDGSPSGPGSGTAGGVIGMQDVETALVSGSGKTRVTAAGCLTRQ
jgi:hypothetical protein